jgi:hypothetical protein
MQDGTGQEEKKREDKQGPRRFHEKEQNTIKHSTINNDSDYATLLK